MRPVSTSMATLVTVAALLLTSSAGATGKLEKSSSSLEDELESTLPRQQPEEQQLKAAAAAAAAAADTTSKQSQHKPKSHEHESQQRGEHHVTHGRQQHHRQQDKSSSQRPSRLEMREMFRQLLESMTDTERQSLTLRLGQESVKRTFSRMKSQARALPVAIGPSPRKRASPRLPPARVLRMRRSLLLGSMESGMAAARQRRRKRDLVDYSPEEYAELAALLADQPADYVEDADGNFRLPEDSEPTGEPTTPAYDDGGEEELEPEQKRQELHGAEERGDESDLTVGGEDRLLGGLEDEDHGDGVKDAAVESSLVLPPLPPPPPPLPQLAEQEEQGRPPLTMFLVRMAGEKGLFVPLDQDRAEHLAEELAGEAAVAEAAETEAEAEAVAAEAQAEAEAEAEAEVEAEKRSQRQAAGVEELKRFAEKLARRVPPGY